MAYVVKEIFYTLQGEGANVGRPAVFCRFSGCNLWTGREEDRGQAVCQFCDTDFLGVNGHGGGRFHDAYELADSISAQWPAFVDEREKFVVCTGGEPLLQLDSPAIAALHGQGFQIAIETNGTILPPEGIDWICCSPKRNALLLLKAGHELKLVYPQGQVDPAEYLHLDFRHFFLQPMDGADREKNTRLAIDYCLRNPRWRLSLQTHKMVGIP